MKIIPFCMFIALFSCHKKETPVPDMPEGFTGKATAMKNGREWTGFTNCWIDLINKKDIYIELDSFYNAYYIKESLNISRVPPHSGPYTVGKNRPPYDNLAGSFGVWEDDFALGDYHILESDSSTNKITISSYDTLSREIKGTFNLSFLVNHRPYPNAPDTVRFTEGSFYGKVVNK